MSYTFDFVVEKVVRKKWKNLKDSYDRAAREGWTYTYAEEMSFLRDGEPTRRKKRVLETSKEEEDEEKQFFLSLFPQFKKVIKK